MNSQKTNFNSESIIHYSPFFYLIACCIISLIFSACSGDDDSDTRPRVTRVRIKQLPIGPEKDKHSLEINFNEVVRFQDPEDLVNLKITTFKGDTTIVDAPLICQKIYPKDQKVLCGTITLPHHLSIDTLSYMATVSAACIDSSSVVLQVVSKTACDTLCLDNLKIR